MTIFKTVALSTSIICASLFLGDVNAIPVPIVDGNGNPVMQNGVQVMLHDNGQLAQDDSIYFLDTHGKMVSSAKNVPQENDILYFLVAANVVAANSEYVRIDYLENAAVLDRNCQGIDINFRTIKAKLQNIELCARLHINDWSHNIPRLRESGLFNDRQKIIDMSFKYLEQTSADCGKKLINLIKEELKLHRAPQNQEIIDRYMMLRVCFNEDRAYGNAAKAIDYLILNAAPGMYPEEIELRNAVNDYLVYHTAKHFCHRTIMGKPTDDFTKKKIQAPKKNNPYTSMSYDGVTDSYDQARMIAQDVYPNIVQYLYDTYDFKFDIDEDRFTIRLATGKSKPNVHSYGTLIDMVKLNVNKLKEISAYQNISPNIYNIPQYTGVQQVAQLLTNNFFYLFFNIGVDLNANQFFRNGGIDGSLFPVAIH